ncbi:MFS transporter [Rhizobium rhizogenes]|uniref:MFS transporter n=1 Tax=Rhizobium rhizogenes TaxID=359 RepID=UPI0015748247|nr:MFS transporter [Rhizobium rhizogenes]NTF45969.1 MFS transporter [Rhizobium rhizogenes]
MAVSEQVVIGKLTRRLLPILIFAYFIAILDRANVGVAALTMNQDLGLSTTAFGFAAGVFFVPYVLLEIPSNLALERFGARWWIARIMLTWGLLSGAHAFVWSAGSLYVLRALLGAAEAGFFPGVVFYLTLWYPSAYRGRIISLFMAGIPIALVIGTPVSTLLLQMDGILGLHGWQWMYLLEGVPAVLLAVCIPFILPSNPSEAKFLDAAERTWLVERLTKEERERSALSASGHGKQLLKALLSPQVLLFCLMYYGLTNLNGAVSTFLPLILKGFGLGQLQTGFVAAIPYLFGLAGMLLLGRLADLPGKRGMANYCALTISIIGLVGAGSAGDPTVKLIFLCVAAFGVFGAMPVFWGLPTAILSGAAAAGGIALINALGNLSSVVNPWVIGTIRDSTGDFNGGLYWLALMAAMSIVVLTIITVLFGRNRSNSAVEVR